MFHLRPFRDVALQLAGKGTGGADVPTVDELLSSAKIWLSFASELSQSSAAAAQVLEAVPVSPALSEGSTTTLVGDEDEADTTVLIAKKMPSKHVRFADKVEIKLFDSIDPFDLCEELTSHEQSYVGVDPDEHILGVVHRESTLCAHGPSKTQHPTSKIPEVEAFPALNPTQPVRKPTLRVSTAYVKVLKGDSAAIPTVVRPKIWAFKSKRTAADVSRSLFQSSLSPRLVFGKVQV